MAAICWRLVRRSMKLYKDTQHIQFIRWISQDAKFHCIVLQLHGIQMIYHDITFSTSCHQVWFGTNMTSKVDSLQLHSCWECPCEAQMIALVNILEGRVEEVNMEPWNVLDWHPKLIHPITFVSRMVHRCLRKTTALQLDFRAEKNDATQWYRSNP